MTRAVADSPARGPGRCLALLGLVLLLLAGCVVGTQEEATSKAAAAFAVADSTPANGATLVSVGTTALDVKFTTALAASYGGFTAVAAQVATLLTLEDVTAEGTPLSVRYSMEYIVTQKTLRLTLEQPLLWEHRYSLTLDATLSTHTGETLGRDVTVAFTAEPNAFNGQVYADRVVAYAPYLPDGESDGAGYFNPEAALGPPRGGTHVVSLGFDKGDVTTVGGFVVLGFGNGTERHCIVDGAGTEFTVVENAAASQLISGVLTEAAYVEVAESNPQDPASFYRFPTMPAALASLADPTAWSGFAGVNVYDLDADTGGDAFDLAVVIAAFALPTTFKACYVKIIDAGAGVPDAAFPASPFSPDKGTGADIDAVIVTPGHSVAEPALTE